MIGDSASAHVSLSRPRFAAECSRDACSPALYHVFVSKACRIRSFPNECTTNILSANDLDGFGFFLRPELAGKITKKLGSIRIKCDTILLYSLMKGEI